MPIGVAGELHIGGDGLARGYLNREELTNEKFIPNPFGPGRLYKTGDKARYLADGNIEYLGRLDNQVKIRGFRIELGEIEAVLNTQTQVQQSIVVAHQDSSGNQRLVAYVVASDKSGTPQQLRDNLKQKLPEYMVPSLFMTLDSLPLTPNGKIDRQALPAPDGEISRSHEYVAPRNPSEEILANIFADLLELNHVGINDNFFEIGGHSLLAVRLMSQIQQHFKVNLPLASLFQNPTIKQLIEAFSDSSQRVWSPLVPIQPNGSLPPFFCIPGAGGNVLYFEPLARYLGDEQPFYGLQAYGLDGETEPLQSVEEIACQYIRVIQTIQPVGPYFLGGHSFGGKVAFEMAQQLQRQGESIGLVAIFDAPAPISQVNSQDSIFDKDDSGWIALLIESIEKFTEESLLIQEEVLLSLNSEGQINYLKQQLERVGLLPPQSDTKLVRGPLQVFRTQNQIDYGVNEALATSIALFQARERNSEDTSNDVFQARAWGWNNFSEGEVQRHIVPGSHTTMMKEPHVKILAQKLKATLERNR